MTITVYTFCWNEMAILPHFFEYYSWADKIIVYDNMSDDGSRDFIQAQPHTELRSYDTGNTYDENTLTKLKNNCWKGDVSDWVVVCDVDEFLTGHEKLEKYIGGKYVFECKCWEMVSEEIPTDFEAVNLKYHFPSWSHKSLCFSPKISEINYSHGAHSSKPIPRNVIRGVLEYKHYDALSEDYLVNKRRKIGERLGKNSEWQKMASKYLSAENDIREEFKARLKMAKEQTV